ncbi:P12 family lipoprotein (plasmid) [Borreliella yangtzensis]|uniref:P12 family lipoprotein n=1 Tax=Borreliella yangtzensis TaxID=683292 RepID=UPI003B219C0F
MPSTDEERRANEAIKNIENILGESRFSKLIKDMSILKNEYTLIKDDLYDVIEKSQNKRALLIKNYNNNKYRIRELVQLGNKLKTGIFLDELINNKIDIAEQEIRSASLFFDSAQESLKEGIIKRLDSKNKASYALQLSRQAISEAESALSNLESSSSKKGEVISIKKEIEELIKDAKTVLVSFNE